MGDLVDLSKFSEQLVLRCQERFSGPDKAPRLKSLLNRIYTSAVQNDKIVTRITKRSLFFDFLKICLLLLLCFLIFSNYKFFLDIFRTQEQGQLIQILEALSNLTLVFITIFITVLTLDKRLMRNRVRKEISILRGLIVELNWLQLEKDPARLFRKNEFNTAHSPRINFNPFELSCYFEYSIEALEICSTILSNFLKNVDDSLVMEEIFSLQSLASAKQELLYERREFLNQLLNEQKS
jgi:hypothetical protein